MFQFTHPVWGATADGVLLSQQSLVSIHAPRVGCDTIHYDYPTKEQGFNSRTPCGVRRVSASRS